MTDLPLLPTTVVGSHARPSWWHACKGLVAEDRWGPADLEELLSDAVDIAILDQERAGVDIITDGECRRLDGYVDSYYGIIEGIRPVLAPRKAGPWGYDQQTRYEAIGRIRTPSGLGIVGEFEYLVAHTDKATKATCAGPLTFASRIRPGDAYEKTVDIATEFAHVINEELRGLVTAGATFIQIDEPARGNVTGQQMGRLFNLATEGIDAKLAFHICFGNRFGLARFKRRYSDYFPGVLEARADQFVLEFASRELAEIEMWKEWNDGRELGAGLIDAKSFYPETPDDVAQRIRTVLQHAAAERVYINPDCGFGWSPRYIATAKLKAMVAGAQIVRDELSGVALRQARGVSQTATGVTPDEPTPVFSCHLSQNRADWRLGQQENSMTVAEELASFVVRASYHDLSDESKHQLKIRVLDSLGCGIGALEGEPIKLLREQIVDFGGRGHCTLIGGGSTSPDRAAFYNCALVRYLDFNDFYLAKGESCHPSDNFGPVLAASEYAGVKGADLMTALAVAYQVQCRLSDEAPVRAKGFDHTAQGSYAVAAGVSKVLGLDVAHTANAIALSGTPFNALRVTRTGALSHWKGLAYPSTAFTCTHAAFLAMRGITGPPEVFEGNKGFMDSIAGHFHIDWSQEGLDRVILTEIKKYNAEGHSQQSIQGILELRTEHGFSAGDVQMIEIETFDVAYNIIGGGEEGDKTRVQNKEQADHSLPYMIAVAILDGQVMPEQYTDERIHEGDVQDLLRKVVVRPNDSYSDRFPNEMPTLLRVTLRDGRALVAEVSDYEGFHSNPMRWESVVEKFERLSERYTDAFVRREIVDAVRRLDVVPVQEFAALLARVQVS